MYQLSIDATTLERYRVGPLGSYLDAYLTRVKQEGFSQLSIFGHLCAIARFSLWLQRRHLELKDVDEIALERFLRRDPGVTRKGELATLTRLLATLRQIGVISERAPEPITVQRQAADEYRLYLSRERGLSEATISNYAVVATHFLSSQLKNDQLEFSTLAASDVTAFVQGYVRQLGPERGRLLLTALRSFLRYLRHCGQISTDLATCVPAVASRTLSTLPKFLPAGAVQRIIDQCDRSKPDGKRNYAILLLLARLGLRAGEIVALNLEDIDWDDGRITIRGKGGRSAQLPLPTDVGEAVAHYLRAGRPRSTCRRVFLRHVAPLHGFTSSGMISTIVSKALIRAGIDSARKGAHLFRHTLATGLLREGASLDEVGELLRHKSPDTTALYAKVDLAALRTLAAPWPGGAR